MPWLDKKDQEKIFQQNKSNYQKFFEQQPKKNKEMIVPQQKKLMSPSHRKKS